MSHGALWTWSSVDIVIVCTHIWNNWWWRWYIVDVVIICTRTWNNWSCRLWWILTCLHSSSLLSTSSLLTVPSTFSAASPFASVTTSALPWLLLLLFPLLCFGTLVVVLYKKIKLVLPIHVHFDLHVYLCSLSNFKINCKYLNLLITHFRDPTKVFKKFIQSKYLHEAALSSIGSPLDPLFTFFLYASNKFFHKTATSLPSKQHLLLYIDFI